MTERVFVGAFSQKTLLNKVPEITLYFWIIKVLCTTVGETAADFLNVNLNLGLGGTSVVTGILLVFVLLFQFRANKYIPSAYWLAVTLVSVFGTLVTDNLSDEIGLPLEVSTIIFGVLLAITFLVWHVSEKTLSIHSIYTKRREAFYWTTILFTFALGTATGDLVSEGLGVGYLMTGILVSAIIAVTAVAWRFRLNSILSFWVIYILTRPLGASIGDLLSQSPKYGGLGLGPAVTSYIFFGGILCIVAYLSITKKDVIMAASLEYFDETKEKGGLWQTAIVLALFLAGGGIGYHLRHAALVTDVASEVVSTNTPSGSVANTSEPVPLAPLGDLSKFRKITQDTLNLLNMGDQSGATTHIGDIEHEWDMAQSRLKSRDEGAWAVIDRKIDTVLGELRAVHPDITSEKSALEALLIALN